FDKTNHNVELFQWYPNFDEDADIKNKDECDIVMKIEVDKKGEKSMIENFENEEKIKNSSELNDLAISKTTITNIDQGSTTYNLGYCCKNRINMDHNDLTKATINTINSSSNEIVLDQKQLILTNDGIFDICHDETDVKNNEHKVSDSYQDEPNIGTDVQLEIDTEKDTIIRDTVKFESHIDRFDESVGKNYANIPGDKTKKHYDEMINDRKELKEWSNLAYWYRDDEREAKIEAVDRGYSSNCKKRSGNEKLIDEIGENNENNALISEKIFDYYNNLVKTRKTNITKHNIPVFRVKNDNNGDKAPDGRACIFNIEIENVKGLCDKEIIYKYHHKDKFCDEESCYKCPASDYRSLIKIKEDKKSMIDVKSTMVELKYNGIKGIKIEEKNDNVDNGEMMHIENDYVDGIGRESISTMFKDKMTQIKKIIPICESILQVIWEVIRWIVMNGLGHVTHILNFDSGKKIGSSSRGKKSVKETFKDNVIWITSKKQKAIESVEMYIYRFDTCVEPIENMVDEDDVVYWFVSGLKEPYRSELLTSSCSSYHVVKVVAIAMEKQLLKVNKQKTISVVNNEEETINKMQEENLPIVTQSEKLEDRGFKSRSHDGEENLEVMVTDMVAKNELDVNDPEFTTSGHSDEGEPVVIKLMNNDGGNGHAIKEKNNLINVKGINEKLSRNQIKGINCKDKPNDSKDDELNMQSNINMDRRMEIVNIPGEVVESDEIKNSTDRLANWLFISGNVYLKEYDDTNVLVIGNHHDSEYENTRNFDEVPRPDSSEHGPSCIIGRKSLLEYKYGDGNRLVYDREKLVAPYNENIAGKQGELIIYVPLMNQHQDRVMKLVRLETTFLVNWVDRLCRWFPEVKDMVEVLAPKYAREKNNESIIYEENRMGYDFEAVTVKGNMNKAVKEDVKTIDYVEKNDINVSNDADVDDSNRKEADVEMESVSIESDLKASGVEYEDNGDKAPDSRAKIINIEVEKSVTITEENKRTMMDVRNTVDKLVYDGMERIVMQIWEGILPLIWEVMIWIVINGLGHVTHISNFDPGGKIKAQPIENMVDEDDVVYWFVSGLKEPYRSELLTSSCSSYHVVKVVAIAMEKQLLKVNKQKTISVVNNEEETINKMQEENLPIVTQSEKLEDRGFKSRSHDGEENLEVMVTDMVAKNELDVNDPEFTTSGHSDEGEPVVIKLMNNDGGNGHAIKEKNNLINVKGINEKLSRNQIKGINCKDKPNDSKDDELNMQSNINMDRRMEIVNIPGEVVESDEIKNSTDRLANWLFISGNVYLKEYDDTNVLVIGNHHDSEYENTRNFDEVPRPDSSEHGPSCIIGRKSLLEYKYGDGNRLVYDREKLVAPYNENIAGKQGELIIYVPLMNQHQDRVMKLVRLETTFLVNWVDRLCRWFPEVKDMVEVLAPKYAREKNNESIIYEENRMGYDFEAVTVKGNMNKAVKEDVKTIDYVEKNDINVSNDADVDDSNRKEADVEMESVSIESDLKASGVEYEDNGDKAPDSRAKIINIEVEKSEGICDENVKCKYYRERIP
ncbi:45071_t:CDS:10, partial [Gigaspora margarita]